MTKITFVLNLAPVDASFLAINALNDRAEPSLVEGQYQKTSPTKLHQGSLSTPSNQQEALPHPGEFLDVATDTSLGLCIYQWFCGIGQPTTQIGPANHHGCISSKPPGQR